MAAFSMVLRVVLVFLVISAYEVHLARGDANRPNIVLIFADDAGYNEFGFASALTATPSSSLTPNLDALAQRSVVARQGYVSSPLCTPSRVGLLTGHYPQQFGMERVLSNHDGPFGLPADARLMSHYMRDLGYTTGAIGKWHLGTTSGVNRPLDMGFDEFYGFLGGSRQYFGGSSSFSRMMRGNDFIDTSWATQGDVTRYDPVNGRYVTDAFGEEAAEFINRHADEPFFLYLPFNAPHTPLHAKQQDLEMFSHIADPTERAIAAMVHAMDRAVGDVTQALMANDIADNTIIVFTNDNGGQSINDNAPYRGFKGLAYEGGIHVPMMISAPGLEPGVYESPVSAYDLLPTFIAAAGGDTSVLPSVGVNLIPYLTGEEQGRPHELMIWRNLSRWAVRRGDWKLTFPSTNKNLLALYDLGSDPTEQHNLLLEQPGIAAELYRELTYWEATVMKPQYGSLGANDRNQFDHFIMRSDTLPIVSWSAAGAWREEGQSVARTLNPEDSYANAVLEFTTRNHDDYIATNDMNRVSGLTFMLNQIKLTGEFDGTDAHSGTINGKPLLLVSDLDGQEPQIRLEAVSNSTATFTFHVHNELQLLNDLEITGDGTQSFILSGDIRDYYEPLAPEVTVPRNVIKSGASQATLTGRNRFGGKLTISGGVLRIAGDSASVEAADGVIVSSQGTLVLESGKIDVPTLDTSSGGQFHFLGGRLDVVDIVGSLTNYGGVYAPRSISGAATIAGDFEQLAGTMEIEIGGRIAGDQYDSVHVSGIAKLGGDISLNLLNDFTPAIGDTFHVLSADDGIVGEFNNTILPVLGEDARWVTVAPGHSLVLLVALAGDYNLDGNVDASDYVVWRQGLGVLYDATHYDAWRLNFGAVATYDVRTILDSFVAAHVPEPSSVVLLTASCIAVSMMSIRWCYSRNN